MGSFITALIIVTALIVVSCPSSNGIWFWTSQKTSDCTGRDGHPYYFGTTNLICMSSKGKRAPDRGLWDISHRWIYYQGFYFERLSDRDVYGTSLTDSDKCSHQMESVPAGYSKLSVDCIQKCTNRYRQKYGGYSLLSNNCHKFANRLSAILCDSVTCPSWCY